MALSLFGDCEGTNIAASSVSGPTDDVAGVSSGSIADVRSARLTLQQAGLGSPAKIRRRRRSGLGSCASTASNQATANEPEDSEATPITSLQKAVKKRWENSASNSKSKSKSKPIHRPTLPVVLSDQFNAHDGADELEWYQKIAASLWQSDILRAQGSHLSHHFGVSDYVVKSTQQRLVLAAMKAHDNVCFGALKNLDAFGFASGQYKPHIFLNVRQYDETPVVLRVDSSDEKNRQKQIVAGGKRKLHANDSDVQCCKLLVTEPRIAALYLASDGKNDFLVESQIPCVLQVLQSNAANILATALHKSGSSGHGGSKPWHQSVAKNFCKLVHVVTTDNFSSNTAAERLLSEAEQNLLTSVPWPACIMILTVFCGLD